MLPMIYFSNLRYLRYLLYNILYTINTILLLSALWQILPLLFDAFHEFIINATLLTVASSTSITDSIMVDVL
jgi:hypothetical protein